MVKSTKELLQTHDFLIKKKFGQNFLTDNNMIQKIVRGANLTPDHTVLEIGPGLGALTAVLSQAAKEVVCIEIDQTLIPILESHGFSNVRIVAGDVLKVEIESLIANKNPVAVVANLPYYISTPIITRLLELKTSSIESLTIMIQKEVADRLTAQPRTKAYGSLTVFVNYHAEVSHVVTVPPSCFIPRPGVDSSVVHLKLNKKKQPLNEAFFYQLVRQSFAKRRKTLLNALTAKESQLGLTKDQVLAGFSALGLALDVRGETLSLDEFIHLSDVLCA